MMNDEQQQYFEGEYQKAGEMIRTLTAKLLELTADLNKAAQSINQQADLIEHLSKDNLKLVAKLDELTGKRAPGSNFAA